MIICLGTTPAVQRVMTFDRLHVDGVNRARTVSQSASGKSLNVARVIHTLGEDAIATGFVGGDAAAFIRKDLDAAGIKHDFIEVEPTTRTCVTVIDEGAGTATELVEESKQVEPEAWGRLLDKLESLMIPATRLVLSGTLPPGAPQDFYAACVRASRKLGVSAIVDATGEPLRLAAVSKAHVMKPNRAEIGRTFGVDTSTEAGVREAIQRMVAPCGGEWAVVTMGGAGVVVSDGLNFWRVTVPQVDVISAIGSGDSFAAGLAVGLERGQPVNEAVILATACGSANALTPVPGFVRPKDVESLQRAITVTALT